VIGLTSSESFSSLVCTHAFAKIC